MYVSHTQTEISMPKKLNLAHGIEEHTVLLSDLPHRAEVVHHEVGAVPETIFPRKPKRPQGGHNFRYPLHLKTTCRRPEPCSIRQNDAGKIQLQQNTCSACDNIRSAFEVRWNLAEEHGWLNFWCRNTIGSPHTYVSNVMRNKLINVYMAAAFVLYFPSSNSSHEREENFWLIQSLSGCNIDFYLKVPDFLKTFNVLIVVYEKELLGVGSRPSTMKSAPFHSPAGWPTSKANQTKAWNSGGKSYASTSLSISSSQMQCQTWKLWPEAGFRTVVVGSL